jgi:hypothetical protein
METTIYSKNGEPVAYIADDGESLYVWDGYAVAYLYEDKVYGWNGEHLGWFVDGIIYDLQGLRVGFIRDRCPAATYAEPAKSAKYARSAKSARSAPSARSAFSTGYKELRDFLEKGSIG